MMGAMTMSSNQGSNAKVENKSLDLREVVWRKHNASQEQLDSMPPINRSNGVVTFENTTDKFYSPEDDDDDGDDAPLTKHLQGQHDQADHAGGSVSTRSNEQLFTVTRNGDGIWLMHDGRPAPDHIQSLGIPPAWRNVYVNPVADGDLLVRGEDAKGRIQSRYGDSHVAQAAADKFGRVNELRGKLDDIKDQVKDDMESGRNREEAACVGLIMSTGLRPGSDKDTGADYQSYGATTLEGQHVIAKDDGSVVLRFTPGKKHGDEIEIPVTDKDVADELVARAARAGDGGRLFNTDDSKLRSYSMSLDGGGFKPKDYRTALGTNTAADYINELPAPRNKKEYTDMVKQVAVRVADKLGNTPKIALGSYIDPHVFTAWQGALND